MRIVLAALGAAVLLTACGTLAQVETQQQGITVDVVEPTSECHVEAEAADNAVLFTASEACSEHRILPLRVVEVDGPEILHDGGVYSGSTTVWPATHSGAFQVRHRQTDHLIGTITLP